MIRAFIAMDVSEDVRRRLEELRKHLERFGKDVKWVPVENVHITLKFLGNIEETRVNGIKEVMQSLACRTKPFTLKAKGTGCFPSIKKIRVVWAGLAGELDKLVFFQRELENNLQKVGFPKEDRTFKPHLTLGRMKSPRNDASLARAIVDNASFESDEFTVDHVTLYKSILKPSGAKYEVLVKMPLEG